MEVQRKLLLQVIERVLPAVARKETFEQADKVAFVGGKAVGFDDRVLISHPLPGDLVLEGAVDGRRIAALLGKLTTEVVDVRVDGDKLTIRASRSRSSFGLLPVTLPIDSVDATGEPVDLPEGLADQMRWVSASCAKNMSRPALNCILVEGGRVQASDSYRASRVRHGAATLPRLMIPLAQVQVLADYPIKRVALSDGREWVRFETDDGVTLSVRALSAGFPDLDKMVFTFDGREVELSAALGEVIERAQIFAKREVQTDEEIRVEMASGKVTVSAQCEGGSFSEVARCEGAVDGVEFSIHPRHLLSALGSGTKCVVGDNRVRFSGADWDIVVVLKGK